MINLILCLFALKFSLKEFKIPEIKFKRNFSVFQSNWQWIGPEGGVILRPLSHPSLNNRVLAPGITDVWMKESFVNFFKIINGLDYVFPLYNSPGILSSPSKGIIVSSNAIFFTNNNWQTIDTTLFTSQIMYVAGEHDDTLYLISYPDSLFRSTDGGQSFNFVSTLPGIPILSDTNYVICVDPSNSNNLGIFAFGPPAIFYYSQDGGNTIEPRDTLPIGMITSLRISPFNSSRMLVFSPDTGVLITDNGGHTWTHLFTLPLFGILAAWDGIFISSDTFILSSILNPGIFRVYKFFGNWVAQPIDTGNFVPFFFEKAGNVIYCGSNNGIYASFNNGNSWTNLKDSLRACIFMEKGMVSIVRDTFCGIEIGGFSFKTHNSQFFHQMGFHGYPSLFGYSCVEISPFSTNKIFLTNPYLRFSGTNILIHALWKSNDGGNTFSPINDSSDLIFYKDIMIGSSDNILFMYNDWNIIRSLNGGISFDTIFSPVSGIDVCDNFKDTLFVLTSADTVFVSYNGGNSFEFLIHLSGLNDIVYDELNKILYLADYSNLYHLNIQTGSFDTVFLSSYTINNIHASEDGWIYSLLTDTLTYNQFIYYTQGIGNPIFVDTVISNIYFNGIIAGKNNLVYAHPMGRSIFVSHLTKVEEFEKKYKKEIALKNIFKNQMPLEWKRFEIYDFCGRRLNTKIIKSGIYLLKEEKTGKKLKIIKID